jgi:hypothetical protein
MREIKRRRIKKIALADKEKIESYTGMSVNTLRNWRSQKKHLGLFLKIGGSVFLNVREWNKLEVNASKAAKREARYYNKINE